MAACSGIKPNGERCKGIPATGSDYCPAHDPARAQARKNKETEDIEARREALEAQLGQPTKGVVQWRRS